MVQVSPYTTPTEPLLQSLRAATAEACVPRTHVMQQEKWYNEKSRVVPTQPTRDIPCSWVGRTNIVNMIILSKRIRRFSPILIKIPTAFFRELEQFFPFYSLNGNKRSKLVKAILKNKTRAGEIRLPIKRLYPKATVISTVYRSMVQEAQR